MSTELKIAEMIQEDAKYRDIQKKHHVGSDTIKRIKDQILKGIIAFDSEGKAFLARPAEAEIESIHAVVMGKITKKASENALKFAEDDYMLGNEVRQYWTLKAQEAGMSLRDFVKGALIFYDEYREEIDGMEKKLEVARWALGQLRGNMIRIAKMELFYKFMRYCIYVREKGLTVPPGLIYDFYHDLTVLEKGGELRTEKKLEVEDNV